MRTVEDLKEMLCKELDEIGMKQELSAGDLDTVNKLTETIKNLYKIKMFEEEYRGDGGSYNGGSSSRRGYSRDSSYGGYSGRHYVRGHYSRESGRDYMMEQLEEIMNNADGREKEALRRCMSQIEKM